MAVIKAILAAAAMLVAVNAGASHSCLQDIEDNLELCSHCCQTMLP
jgi:hypothetical protein